VKRAPLYLVLANLACTTAPVGPGKDAGDAATPKLDATDAAGEADVEDMDVFVPDVLPVFYDPFQGEVGCDAAFRGAFECTGETLLHGGLDRIFLPTSCAGAVGSPVLTFGGLVVGDVKVQIVLVFASGLAAGVAGDQPPATLTVTYPGADGGAALSWGTPAGACAVTLDSNVCLPGTARGDYAISGTGSCSAEALPQGGNPGAPVEIPGFSFSAYLAAVDAG
jgi:hypothetical protein